MKTQRPRIVEDVERILKGITTAEELVEIEKAITEVKGKILVTPAEGFWAGKSPCWEMCHCPEVIKNECPAPKFQSLPCWKMEGTYCKLDDFSSTGTDTSICEVCRVYKRHGNDELIKIELFGKGIDAKHKLVEEKAKTASGAARA